MSNDDDQKKANQCIKALRDTGMTLEEIAAELRVRGILVVKRGKRWKQLSPKR